MGTFYFIRHGESIANMEGRYQGQTYDTDLSPLGILQASAVANHLRAVPFELIITSPLLRTRRTAQMVGNHHNVPVTSEPAIIEINHGHWEGRHKHAVARLWPDEFGDWMSRPSQAQFPGGEHVLETMARVLGWWEKLQWRQGTYLIVTHDAILRLLFAYLHGFGPDRIWYFRMDPTGVSVVQTTGEHVKVERVNDVTHLGGGSANLDRHAL